MRNAMAIILGANLGTTLDSWVVALGFNMDIEVVSYPALCRRPYSYPLWKSENI
jgi:phosphate:Na+ symporter